jgi:hypothetical protein
MGKVRNTLNAKQTLADLKKFQDGTKTISEVARQLRTSHQWARELMLKYDIQYRAVAKRLNDVQRYQIRKLANETLTIKSLAAKVNASDHSVRKFCDQEQLPYKSYPKNEVKESKFFCWEMYNFNVY